MAGSGQAPSTRRLWFGVLGGPAAWVLEILLVYYTSGNCTGREVILIAGTVAIAGLAGAAGVMSWRISRQVDTPSDGQLSDRVAFYATGGVYISGLSIFVVLMVLLTALILGSSCG